MPLTEPQKAELEYLQRRSEVLTRKLVSNTGDRLFDPVWRYYRFREMDRINRRITYLMSLDQ